jgi:membrane protein insertase Oxa1/YidC/SpoIIIJ
MPVIMLFMLYNLPSGLTLYWTVSQVFSILQMKYGQIIAERQEAKAAAEPPAK